jgi:hypothetical protein
VVTPGEKLARLAIVEESLVDALVALRTRQLAAAVVLTAIALQQLCSVTDVDTAINTLRAWMAVKAERDARLGRT